MKKIKIVNESLKNGKKEDVGTLYFSNGEWVFTYSDKWSTQIGFELSIEKRIHRSLDLFGTFSERIPSRDNGAYSDYCKSWKISESESDIMTLLVTIGHRGPSTLVFYPEGFTPGMWSETDD